MTSSAVTLRSPEVFYLFQSCALHLARSPVLCFIHLESTGSLRHNCWLCPDCSFQVLPYCTATALYCLKKDKKPKHQRESLRRKIKIFLVQLLVVLLRALLPLKRSLSQLSCSNLVFNVDLPSKLKKKWKHVIPNPQN